jgi:hypothetical protein
LITLAQSRQSKSTTAASATRTRSLDSPASIQLEPTAIDKGKQKAKPARDRAGTIRASDYQQTKVPPVAVGASTSSAANVSHPYVRRTRSGTVVGPLASSAIMAPTPVVSHQHRIGSSSRIQSQTQTQDRVAPQPKGIDIDIESDDELLLKTPGWLDVDFEYLGLPTHKFHSHALNPQANGESDDELLLTGKWRDAYDDWPKEV